MRFRQVSFAPDDFFRQCLRFMISNPRGSYAAFLHVEDIVDPTTLFDQDGPKHTTRVYMPIRLMQTPEFKKAMNFLMEMCYELGETSELYQIPSSFLHLYGNLT
jgi:hypothetical protein